MSSGHAHLTLVTHGGRFHCDDVFAYVILRLALGAACEDRRLIRTRDPALILSADIVWDVGTVFEPEAGRFDHHQRGAPRRPDGTPFSAAGLVWQVYGERAVSALLAETGLPESRSAAGDRSAAIAADLDESLLLRIDEVDTGVSVRGPVVDDPLGLGRLIDDFNPPWDTPAAASPQATDAAFLEAAALAEGVLRRRVSAVRARIEAEAIVLAAHATGSDPRILVLDRGMPWKNAVFAHDLPVIFTVSPATNGNWMIDAAPPEPGSFAQRLPLPEAWAGLEGAELAAASGVEDAVFVHLRRFVGAARSREGAIAMVRQTLDQTLTGRL